MYFLFQLAIALGVDVFASPVPSIIIIINVQGRNVGNYWYKCIYNIKSEGRLQDHLGKSFKLGEVVVGGRFIQTLRGASRDGMRLKVERLSSGRSGIISKSPGSLTTPRVLSVSESRLPFAIRTTICGMLELRR